MNYIERINDNLRQPVRGVVIPPHVFDYALSLKQPEALADIPTPDAFEGLDPFTQDLMMARTVGNWSVRLALASYLASTQDHNIQPLGDMDAPSREELIYTSLTENVVPTRINITDFDVRRSLATSKRAETNRLRDFMSYLDARPGKFPPGNWPRPPFGHNDVTLTQAFGRNSLTDGELPLISHNRALSETDEEMLSLLNHDGFEAGASNEALAEVIAGQLSDPAVIIEQVVQWEVAFALWQKYPELYARCREAIHVTWPHPGARAYRTFEVKEDSRDIMEKIGLYNAYEFAHPDMMIRARLILRKLGIEADILAADIPFPFDPDSKQYQTRSSGAWFGREILTRAEHVLMNRIEF